MSRALRHASRWAAKEVASGLAAPITNAAFDGAMILDNGVVAADQAWRGLRGLHRNRRQVSAIVGGEFWHGGGDRRNALAQLGTDFQTFENDLTASAEPAPSSDAAWIVADVAPALAEWRNFVARMAASSISAYVTEWSVFESWIGRLRKLRDAARARGIYLGSPEPEPLPQTVWQRGANGTGTALDVWIAAGKTAVFGAIAITGVIAFFSLTGSVHALIMRKYRS